MKVPRLKRLKLRGRRGAIAVITGLLLTVILGMVALAFDVGWILMTKTQLQAAADASALAGGTVLLDGLGYMPIKTPGEVATEGTLIAAAYARNHPNGDVGSTHIDPAENVVFGWAELSKVDGKWIFSSGGQDGTGWYNAIRVTLKRDVNEGNALPLILAPVLGHTTADVTAHATAVIMPARGFVIEPGSGETANLIPFAVDERFWYRYLRAQVYYDEHPNVLSSETLSDIPDPEYPTEPLFGALDDKGDFQQLMTDTWSTGSVGNGSDTATAISKTPDGTLELNIFPYSYSPGNFGTVDLRAADNSTAELSRQIESGVTEEDLGELGLQPGETFSLTSVPTVTGDTGISGGMAPSLDAILGECRSVLLFSSVAEPGNNATFTLSGFAGVRLVSYELTGPEDLDPDGEKKFKHIMIQRCNYSDPGAIGDLDDEIGENTTVFTPLILIE